MFDESFVMLRKTLLKYYTDTADIIRVADDAGLDISRVKHSDKPEVFWHEVLKEAKKQNKVRKIYEVVSSEYELDFTLEKLHEKYKKEPEREKRSCLGVSFDISIRFSIVLAIAILSIWGLVGILANFMDTFPSIKVTPTPSCVTKQVVDIRSGPAFFYPVVDSLPKETGVNPIAITMSTADGLEQIWLRVFEEREDGKGKSGWVPEWYIKCNSDITLLPRIPYTP